MNEFSMIAVEVGFWNMYMIVGINESLLLRILDVLR